MQALADSSTMASGRLALLAASVGDLESVKWAHLHARPLSPETNAGMLCKFAAARADLRMLRWALENGGVGPSGSVVIDATCYCLRQLGDGPRCT